MTNRDRADLISIARLSFRLQSPIPRIRAALQELGVEPALTLSGVAMYRVGVLDALCPMLQGTHAEEGKK